MIGSAQSQFHIDFSDGGLTSLRYREDSHETQYILKDRRFGDVCLSYRNEDGEWKHASTQELVRRGWFSVSESEYDDSRFDTVYRSGSANLTDLHIHTSFQLLREELAYTIRLQNVTDRAIHIGDLSVPFPMNSAYEWGTKPHESVLRHCFISGHNSYLFWMRGNSAGPYLALFPTGDTSLEFFDMQSEPSADSGARAFRAYIHSEAEGEQAKAKGTRWRQPHTGATLAPKGTPGSEASYTFKFQWVQSYDDMRGAIAAAGKIDIGVVPGMTVPSDLFAMFYLRTGQRIESVTAEYPEETELECAGQRGEGLTVYKAKFRRLGENLLTVRYGGGKRTYLEFFVTEPVETLIAKRAAFIADKQRRDPSKWYNGLFSEWNMETGVALSPDNYDRIKGWRIYEVTCDDPGLSKPAFLAAKNAEFPVRKEIEALEYYIEHFVWGGLQRTDAEEYSYGIYGIPDWYRLRNSEDEGSKGKTHIWRIYDYPHIALMYWSMYRITRNYPNIQTKISKDVYLERAYRTAVALFTIPMETEDWSAYKTGLYNELIIVDILRELRKLGLNEKAYRLEKHWRKKVSYFVNENADLFGSEYPFDSTGFESTHAIAKYALNLASENGSGAAAESEEAARNAHSFMESQMKANLFCRGWLSPAYYLYGSDYRKESNAAYTLSYMSQMGGWAVLDYGLRYSSETHPYVRLGYASLLSSWALMNTGTPESGYGYWYPGEANDGAAGGGFEPSPYGMTWLEQEHRRGSWYYSCEVDLGYCGALRGAATILADDPLFGLFCYGGEVAEADGSFEISMKDGVRKRLSILLGNAKVSMCLEGGRIAADKPVIVKPDLTSIRFTVEGSREGTRFDLSVEGLPEGEYGVYADRVRAGTLTGGAVESDIVMLVRTEGAQIEIRKEQEKANTE